MNDLSLPSLAEPDPRTHVRGRTLRRIRHFLDEPEDSVYTELKGLCEKVSDSYRDRVVLELLQNAHDAHDRDRQDGRIHIVLDPRHSDFGALIVANDGRGFSADNFKALCSPSRTTKTVNDAIGNKGVGFLSVFQVSAHPEVYSRSRPDSLGFDGYCFRFADDETIREFLAAEGLAASAEQVQRGMPRLHLACPVDEVPPEVEALAREGYATVVRLPLKSSEAFEAVAKQLEQLTQGPPVQLFLTRIAELSVAHLGRAPEPVRLPRSSEAIFEGDGLRLLDVSCGADRFIVAQRAIPESVALPIIQEDVAAGHLPEAWLDWTGDALVSLAVAAEGLALSGRMYNFLPMGEEAASPFPGHLDAPFHASINRLQLQAGVSFNTTLWTAARTLAVDAARSLRGIRSVADAARPGLDLLFWGGPDREPVLDALDRAGDRPIPVLRGGSREWARATDARVWQGDELITPQLVAQVSTLAIVDPDIGADRAAKLAAFLSGRHTIACSSQDRGRAVEAVAAHLHKKKAARQRWDAFYRSLAQLFRSDSTPLAGRLLLLTARNELAPTEVKDDEPKKRGRRKRRLSAVFLPPLRGSGDSQRLAVHDLPKAVYRRLDYVDDRLEMAIDGSSEARRFFVHGQLVREHESREILRMLVGAMHEPGDVKDPEALRWAALTAIMRIVRAEDTAEGVVQELSVPVPARAGWIRASTAYFSGTWTGEGSLGLQDLLQAAEGQSAELAEHAGRLLLPFPDWPVPAAEREAWVSFLSKAGVVDHLRPVPLLAGAAPRANGSGLAWSLGQRGGLPAEQAGAWRALLNAQPGLPNPQTPYTVSGLLRLPGQLDHAALTPIVAHAYAHQVLRTLEASPGLPWIAVYRPESHHATAQNRRDWPSPVMAFMRAAHWLPLADGTLSPTTRAWLPGPGAAPPPRLPLVDHTIVAALARRPKAAEALHAAKLNVYGERAHAWRFLQAAAEIVDQGVTPFEGERLLAAATQAWREASLVTAPETLQIIGRQRNAIVSTTLGEEGPPILVADGDDRQIVAATVRPDPDTVVFEPPRNRALEIGALLEQRDPERVSRAVDIAVSYECDGEPVAFLLEAPFIEDVLGPGLRDVLILSLRYKNSFFDGDLEQVLQTLGLVRLRWLPDLQIRVGELVEPAPRFRERAVLLKSPHGATILAHEALNGTPHALTAIAEALGAALGDRRAIGEPLLAFAAQLRPDPLACSDLDLAQVLEVPVEEVRGVLGSARAALAATVRALRPIVWLYAGEVAATTFTPGALLSEDEVLRALEAVAESLPLGHADLLQRARQGEVGKIAAGLDLDLAALNEVLLELGPPYAAIDYTQQHEDTLRGFLLRREGVIRESIRVAFRAEFEAGRDLSGYVRARDAVRPALPDGFGRASLWLTQGQMAEWLEQWLAGLGVTEQHSPGTGRETLDAVREFNLRRVRAIAPTLRVAILKRTPPNHPLRGAYQTATAAEAALVSAGTRLGWCDFERLGEDTALLWIARSALWPDGWATRLDDLAVTTAEVAEVAAQDERDRAAAATRRRVIEYSGGSFSCGVDSFGALADQISSLVAGNTALLATPTRTTRGVAPIIRRRPAGPGGGPGGPGGPGPGARLSDEERDVIGFFGEAIAFDWLKRRFGGKRVVDLSCWKSGYRRHLAGGGGEDHLGYDFEVQSGQTTWYFEVKATKIESVADRHTIELGSSEIAHAEVCWADKRSRFRILYIVDALHPEKAQLFVLPNPRSDEGRSFYAEPIGAGVRLMFPLPSGARPGARP